ncbi:Htaa domain protein, partial [Streptomyces sp. ME02-6977A]|nr:Htaa domain protein [Streptomyces sp. ME02-6977A]
REGDGKCGEVAAATTDAGDFPALPVSLAAGALLLAAAALVTVAQRRRNRARPAASPADPEQG